jgi:hypothetical protein
MTTTWTLSQLSTEWVGPITVAADGDPVTGWTYTLTPYSDTPDSADAIDGTPDVLDDGLGILVGPGTTNQLTPGVYRIWVRYGAAPEAPVLNNVGLIHIT